MEITGPAIFAARIRAGQTNIPKYLNACDWRVHTICMAAVQISRKDLCGVGVFCCPLELHSRTCP